MKKTVKVAAACIENNNHEIICVLRSPNMKKALFITVLGNRYTSIPISK